jgi:phosphohistidine phosphatase
MNLFILRHGIAVEHGAPGFANDSERPLTDEGEKQLRHVSRVMEKMDLQFDLILSSPFLRAKQTAEIVAGDLKLKKRLQLFAELTPYGAPQKLVQRLNESEPRLENVLLVGHEPYLSRLAALLISGDANAAIDLKKGGLCKLELEILKPGRCAMLAWLLTPKQMKWMA